jgi:hypothetical protein
MGGRVSLSLTDKALLETSSVCGIDCLPRAAVGIETVSADSLRKTGISADKAGDFRRLPPQDRRAGSLETKSNARKAGISGPFSGFFGSLTERLNGWLGREDSSLEMANWNQTLSPVREKPQSLFSLKLISNSKRLNFENRTGSVESRASERNGSFGE